MYICDIHAARNKLGYLSYKHAEQSKRPQYKSIAGKDDSVAVVTALLLSIEMEKDAFVRLLSDVRKRMSARKEDGRKRRGKRPTR